MDFWNDFLFLPAFYGPYDRGNMDKMVKMIARDRLSITCPWCVPDDLNYANNCTFMILKYKAPIPASLKGI